MSEYIHQFLSYTQQHQNWAWAITFLITFVDSTLIIGLFIPSTALLIGVGALIGADSVPVLPILVAGAAGCLAGDTISYYFGKKIGRRAFASGPFAKHRRWYAKTRLFISKYGMSSIFIGRFIGMRSLIAGVAGMLNINKVKFYIANFLSACIWVPMWVMLGYMGLRWLREFKNFVNKPVFWVVVFVLILVIAGVWFYIHKRKCATKS